MNKIFRKNNRVYYSSKNDALIRKRKGDRLYYSSKEKAYFIVRPKKKNLFGVL